MTKLENNIRSLRDYVDTFEPDKSNGIYVDKAALITIIDDIQKSLPQELEMIQALLRDANNTREESREDAKKFLEQAKAKRDEMLSESAQVKMAEEKASIIIQQANAKADSIVQDAQKESLKVYREALSYYVQSMKECENQISGIVSSFAHSYQSLYDKANDSYKKLDAFRQNRENDLNNVDAQIATMEQLEKQRKMFNDNNVSKQINQVNQVNQAYQQ